MNLPGFLGPGTTLSPSAALGAGGGGGSLAFVIEPQLQTNWCWAAVSKSVSWFYDQSSPWTQCRVANAALPRTDCCGGKPPPMEPDAMFPGICRPLWA